MPLTPSEMQAIKTESTHNYKTKGNNDETVIVKISIEAIHDYSEDYALQVASWKYDSGAVDTFSSPHAVKVFTDDCLEYDKFLNEDE